MATEVARETKARERRARNERAPVPTKNNKPTKQGAVEIADDVSAADWVSALDGTNARVAEHVVFLVPGLLGFERFSTFSYFGERVVASLRAGLEQSLSQPVPVVPVPISPTASLADRQRGLVKTLSDRLHALEHGYRPLHVHLLGHSTGGVDANLLTLMKPLGGGQWEDLDPRAPALLERIRSVTSIGSPHQGACLASDPAVQVLGERKRDLRGGFALAKLASTFALSSIGDVELSDLAVGLQREGGKMFRFFYEVLRTWRLLADLQPSQAWGGDDEKRPGVQRRSFVTVAGSPKPGVGTVEPADAFFRALSSRASGWATGRAEEGPLVQASVERLRKALVAHSDGLLIKASGTELPSVFDAGLSDGIVNSARQLVDPTDPDELAGIVVADHYDVVGYYDRDVWTLDRQGNERAAHMLSGLLHSGSGFRDNQFYDLYRRVAQVIAASASATASASTTARVASAR